MCFLLLLLNIKLHPFVILLQILWYEICTPRYMFVLFLQLQQKLAERRSARQEAKMMKDSMSRESTLDSRDERLRRTPSSGGSMESPLVWIVMLTQTLKLGSHFIVVPTFSFWLTIDVSCLHQNVYPVFESETQLCEQQISKDGFLSEIKCSSKVNTSVHA